MRSMVAVLLVLIALSAAAQDQPVNIREDKAFGFSLVAGGAVIGGLTLDGFISSRMNLELSAGFGFAGGFRYHPMGDDPNRSWSPYLGITGAMIPEIKLFDTGGDWRPALYLPLGLHYISRSGFSLALEAGYYHGFSDESSSGSFDAPWFGFKIGWRI